MLEAPNKLKRYDGAVRLYHLYLETEHMIGILWGDPLQAVESLKTRIG